MAGQPRAMLEATPPDGRYRETVIDHSTMYHRSFGHVPIHTATHPCGKGPISALLKNRCRRYG